MQPLLADVVEVKADGRPLVPRPERDAAPRDRRAQDILSSAQIARDLRHQRRERIDARLPSAI
jgi:hypothetical protein